MAGGVVNVNQSDDETTDGPAKCGELERESRDAATSYGGPNRKTLPVP